MRPPLFTPVPPVNAGCIAVAVSAWLPPLGKFIGPAGFTFTVTAGAAFTVTMVLYAVQPPLVALAW